MTDFFTEAMLAPGANDAVPINVDDPNDAVQNPVQNPVQMPVHTPYSTPAPIPVYAPTPLATAGVHTLNGSSGNQFGGHNSGNGPFGNQFRAENGDNHSSSSGVPPRNNLPPQVPLNYVEKPEKFSCLNFKMWQQKMFYLTTLHLARFVSETVPVFPDRMDAESLTAIDAWKHSNYLCRNYILNGLCDQLFNVYCHIKTAKDLWEVLDRKYKTQDADATKFVVGRFLDFMMVDSKTVTSQVQEFQLILHEIHAEGMTLSEAFQVAAVIEKLPPGWKDFKYYLKHKRKQMTMEDLVVRLRIEEDNRKAQRKIPVGARANVVEHINSQCGGTEMITLDLGDNRFSGTLPAWIGDKMPSLLILRLRSNRLNGIVPRELCKLASLHILDHADNQMSGIIPSCFINLNGMKSDLNTERYEGQLQVFAKGRQLLYQNTLFLVNSIDISSNNLSGKIPPGVTELLRLGTLNMSNNHLTGAIPEKIGQLQRMETLDLSRNRLAGRIPASMTDLTALNFLNISYNNLWGRIPRTNQFGTFTDASIYAGNPGLCGFPLLRKCSDEAPAPDIGGRTGKKGLELDNLGLFVSVGLGSLWASGEFVGR